MTVVFKFEPEPNTEPLLFIIYFLKYSGSTFRRISEAHPNSNFTLFIPHGSFASFSCTLSLFA